MDEGQSSAKCGSPKFSRASKIYRLSSNNLNLYQDRRKKFKRTYQSNYKHNPNYTKHLLKKSTLNQENSLSKDSLEYIKLTPSQKASFTKLEYACNNLYPIKSDTKIENPAPSVLSRNDFSQSSTRSSKSCNFLLAPDRKHQNFDHGRHHESTLIDHFPDRVCGRNDNRNYDGVHHGLLPLPHHPQPPDSRWMACPVFVIRGQDHQGFPLPPPTPDSHYVKPMKEFFRPFPRQVLHDAGTSALKVGNVDNKKIQTSDFEVVYSHHAKGCQVVNKIDKGGLCPACGYVKRLKICKTDFKDQVLDSALEAVSHKIGNEKPIQVMQLSLDNELPKFNNEQTTQTATNNSDVASPKEAINPSISKNFGKKSDPPSLIVKQTETTITSTTRSIYKKPKDSIIKKRSLQQDDKKKTKSRSKSLAKPTEGMPSNESSVVDEYNYVDTNKNKPNVSMIPFVSTDTLTRTKNMTQSCQTCFQQNYSSMQIQCEIANRFMDTKKLSCHCLTPTETRSQDVLTIPTACVPFKKLDNNVSSLSRSNTFHVPRQIKCVDKSQLKISTNLLPCSELSKSVETDDQILKMLELSKYSFSMSKFRTNKLKQIKNLKALGKCENCCLDAIALGPTNTSNKQLGSEQTMSHSKQIQSEQTTSVKDSTTKDSRDINEVIKSPQPSVLATSKNVQVNSISSKQVGQDSKIMQSKSEQTSKFLKDKISETMELAKVSAEIFQKQMLKDGQSNTTKESLKSKNSKGSKQRSSAEREKQVMNRGSKIGYLSKDYVLENFIGKNGGLSKIDKNSKLNMKELSASSQCLSKTVTVEDVGAEDDEVEVIDASTLSNINDDEVLTVVIDDKNADTEKVAKENIEVRNIAVESEVTVAKTYSDIGKLEELEELSEPDAQETLKKVPEKIEENSSKEEIAALEDLDEDNKDVNIDEDKVIKEKDTVVTKPKKICKGIPRLKLPLKDYKTITKSVEEYQKPKVCSGKFQPRRPYPCFIRANIIKSGNCCASKCENEETEKLKDSKNTKPKSEIKCYKNLNQKKPPLASNPTKTCTCPKCSNCGFCASYCRNHCCRCTMPQEVPQINWSRWTCRCGKCLNYGQTLSSNWCNPCCCNCSAVQPKSTQPTITGGENVSSLFGNSGGFGSNKTGSGSGSIKRSAPGSSATDPSCYIYQGIQCRPPCACCNPCNRCISGYPSIPCNPCNSCNPSSGPFCNY